MPPIPQCHITYPSSTEVIHIKDKCISFHLSVTNYDRIRENGQFHADRIFFSIVHNLKAEIAIVLKPGVVIHYHCSTLTEIFMPRPFPVWVRQSWASHMVKNQPFCASLWSSTISRKSIAALSSGRLLSGDSLKIVKIQHFVQSWHFSKFLSQLDIKKLLLVCKLGVCDQGCLCIYHICKLLSEHRT